MIKCNWQLHVTKLYGSARCFNRMSKVTSPAVGCGIRSFQGGTASVVRLISWAPGQGENRRRHLIKYPADGGGRTHTLLPVLDFESSASASSATSALSREKITSASGRKRKCSEQKRSEDTKITQMLFALHPHAAPISHQFMRCEALTRTIFAEEGRTPCRPTNPLALTRRKMGRHGT